MALIRGGRSGEMGSVLLLMVMPSHETLFTTKCCNNLSWVRYLSSNQDSCSSNVLLFPGASSSNAN